jgi:hypothetical protein
MEAFGHLSGYKAALKELLDNKDITYGGRDVYYRNPRATMGEVQSILVEALFSFPGSYPMPRRWLF